MSRVACGYNRNPLCTSALIVKYFYGFFSEDKIGEFAFVAGGFYDVIVYPMIVAASGFAKDDAVILKAVFFEYLYIKNIIPTFVAQFESNSQ